MPRKRGVQRIITRGENGLRGVLETAEKKTERSANKLVEAMEARDAEGFSKVVLKTHLTDTRLAVSKALDAIGLDPRNKKQREARKISHQFSQTIAKVKFDEMRRIISKKDADLIVHAHNDIIFGLIEKAKGKDAIQKFIDAYEKYIDILNQDSTTTRKYRKESDN